MKRLLCVGLYSGAGHKAAGTDQSLQQRFCQGRLTLSATAVLPFQNRYEGAARDTVAATYRQHNAFWYNPRQCRFGLTWRFGKTEISLKRARKSAVNDKL